MAQATNFSTSAVFASPVAAAPVAHTLTANDLAAEMGAIPVHRIRASPPLQPVTEDDVVAIHAHEDRLFELADGILIEKATGFIESQLVMLLGFLLNSYAIPRQAGVVAGESGIIRLKPGLVRIPDVSFITKDRLPDGLPRDAICKVIPDLAVEIISEGNTPQEMSRKTQDYFAAGVRLVWYVYPEKQTIDIYASADHCTTASGDEAVSGDDVLPGFSFTPAQLFGLAKTYFAK